MSSRAPAWCLTVFVAGIGVLSCSGARLARAADGPCTYYASPDGNGDGQSAEKPSSVRRFLHRAKPGDTLCLADGTYRGTDSMVVPPQGLNGQPGQPITVRALHDGRVTLDGEGARQPVRFYQNDWFVMEGINACCSSATVVEILRSSNDVIRRVAAWDAAEGNYSIYGIHYGDHNLLEDVAGWGIARKTYESSQDGNSTTIRRAWGRWEGSHVGGPKMVYALTYNNRDMLVENSIGTWSGERMKESYSLLDYKRQPIPGQDYHNYDVNQAYAIFAIDALTKGDKNARARLLGSMAYITGKDTYKPVRLVLVTKLDSVEIADMVAYVEPGSHPRVNTFGLYGLGGSGDRSGAMALRAHDLTSVDGAGPVIGRDWQTRNILQLSSIGGGPSENIGFLSARGARLCHRYVDGVLTDQPLWPWPMNQRIIDAMSASGRQPVDVTAAIQQMLGPIPPQCSATPEQPPETPSAPGQE